MLDVGPVEINKALPMCLTFDFNINPATVVLGQPHGDEPWVWREAFTVNRGGEATRASAEAAEAHLRSIDWDGEVRIYGDATGSGPKTTGPSDHAVLREVFPSATWCIKPANPHQRDRVAAVNARCETVDRKRHIRVDPSCRKLISDLEQVVFLPTGELDKKTNPMLTHVSDAFGYWVHREWPVKHVAQAVGRSLIERCL
jgi:hypothetical protein